MYSKVILTFALSLFAGLCSAQTAPLYGFTTFPYDSTEEAVAITEDVVSQNSNFHVIHMDGCLPWREALYNLPFPAWLSQDWAAAKAKIPAGRPVYIAVTPTAMDRINLAPACGSSESAAGVYPSGIAGAKLSATAVKTAFRNYVRRVVQTFSPTYLVLGIEISELALNYPAEWPAFDSLYRSTLADVKARYPTVKVGPEMVLSSIMVSSVGSMVKPIIDASDYLGISFYPYGDNAAIGLPALPAPPYQWRNPLAWLKTYTTKPIAICETGYTTKNHVVNAGVNINYTGDETMQAIFVRELIQTAKREGYLFVVWFVSIDYEALLAKLPADLAWTKIWVNTGLVTPDLQAKPAFWEWQAWNQ